MPNTKLHCIYVLLHFSPRSAPLRQVMSPTAQGENKYNPISLNPTQHWVNLLSDCHSISFMTQPPLPVKSNPPQDLSKRKQNVIISSTLNLDTKQRKSLSKIYKKYICSQQQWDPVGQWVEERKLYRNKKSDAIIYHLKSNLFMRQKQNEILGWIHPELFNLKWLIPYKAQADPSSVLINTLSFSLNRKTGGGERRGAEKITSRRLLLCFVLETVGLNVFSAKFERFASIIQVDGNAFFIKHLGLIINKQSYSSVYFNDVSYYWLYDKVTEVDKDVTLT